MSEEELVDVVEVEIVGSGRRVMQTGMTKPNAEAFIMIAIMRRGVETHFYTTQPSTPQPRTGMTKDRASRLPAPNEVEKQEASMGDVPKQGSGPQHDLRDAGIVAQALAIIQAECDRQNEASNAAKAQGRTIDMYRHNTALQALWIVENEIGGLSHDQG